MAVTARAAPSPKAALAQAAAAERGGRFAEVAMLLSALPPAQRSEPAVAHRLARALERSGRPFEALPHHCTAYLGARKERSYRQALAAALARMRPAGADPGVEALVLELADADDVELAAPVPLALLGGRRAWQAALAAARRGDAGAVAALAARPAPEGLAGDGFLVGMMQHLLLPGEEAEQVLTALRRGLLGLADSGPTADAPPEELLAGLALQAWWAEYCWAESAEEAVAVERLGEALAARAAAGDGAPGPLPLCVHAMYRPPGRFPAAWYGGGLQALGRTCLLEPAEERRLAAGLPHLTPVADPTSLAVQAQYDEHPYPRWRSVRRQAPQPLPDVATHLFPWLRPKSLPRGSDRPRILVAGCGTGAHAVKVASRYRGGQVLAVDLSPRALGFAARRAAELKAATLRFAVADLLELGAMPERFQLIECSGVLHHLADPVAGWRVLAGLLAPRGLMKIGLYSTAARRDIAAVREWIAARGLRGDAAGIRAARAAILALPPAAPERQVARELDFYSASTCRDLLFHVREVTVTLPELAGWLERLELEFIGFEIADPGLLRRFRAAFPAEAALRDLACWHRFEQAEPAAFRTMYQFWCRRKGGG